MSSIMKPHVSSATANSDKKSYSVTVIGKIAFDWSGYTYSACSYTITCDGTSKSGTADADDSSATYWCDSGGGSFVWSEVANCQQTFTVNMSESGKSKEISLYVTMDTHAKPSTSSGSSTYTLPALTWQWPVKYNANGGSGAPADQTKTYGSDLTLSSTTPTRTGYNFLGWNTTSSATTANTNYNPGKTYSTDAALTLYAVWQKQTYTVTYNANGGSGAPGNQTKTYGTTLTLSSTKPSRTNYEFQGWSTSSGGSVVYASGGSYTDNKAITLYAVWKLKYIAPTLSSVQVIRCTSDGTQDDTSGTYCKLTGGWKCDQTIGENLIESLTYKIGTGTAQSLTYSSTSGKTNKEGTFNQIISGFSVDSSYTITVTLKDKKGSGTNGTVSSTVTLGSAAYPIDISNNGIGIGMVASSSGWMDVAHQAHFYKDVYVGPKSGTTPFASTIRVGTQSTSGDIYLFSKNTASESNGIWAHDASGNSIGVLLVKQDKSLAFGNGQEMKLDVAGKWLYAPTNGISPYSKDSTNGVGSIGDSTGPFKNLYVKNINGNAYFGVKGQYGAETTFSYKSTSYNVYWNYIQFTNGLVIMSGFSDVVPWNLGDSTYYGWGYASQTEIPFPFNFSSDNVRMSASVKARNAGGLLGVDIPYSSKSKFNVWVYGAASGQSHQRSLTINVYGWKA